MVFVGTKRIDASQKIQEISLNKWSGDGDGVAHQGFQSLFITYLLETANVFSGKDL